MPGGQRALVQAKGGHDGLQRAAVRQQRHHESHLVQGRAQAIEERAYRGDKGLAAHGAPIASVLLAVDTDVPFAHLSSGRADRIVAELSRRVEHEPPPLDRSLATTVEEQAACRPFSVVLTFDHG